MTFDVLQMLFFFHYILGFRRKMVKKDASTATSFTLIENIN